MKKSDCLNDRYTYIDLSLADNRSSCRYRKYWRKKNETRHERKKKEEKKTANRRGASTLERTFNDFFSPDVRLCFLSSIQIYIYIAMECQ